jgi:hypothetical protein
MQSKRSARWYAVVVLAFAAGALLTEDSRPAQGKADDEVKDAFGKLQAAIKAKDAAKIWDLLDSATKADAERTAKIVKAAYKKANDEAKTKHNETLGLKADEVGRLDGQSLLNTKPFHAKYNEIPDSKITGISVQGDSATLNYLEPDGDKEKLNYSRQDGKWKVAMPMPQFPK